MLLIFKKNLIVDHKPLQEWGWRRKKAHSMKRGEVSPL